VIELVVDGQARGKDRPRVTSRGTFTSQRTRAAETHTRQVWLAAGRPRIDGPLHLTVEVVVQRPQTHWKVDGTLSAAGERQPVPARKPDLDNAVKLHMDALNGCAYRDDVDVVHLTAWRRWANAGEHPHTRIRLKPAPMLAGVRGVA
jgi:Holliday junction resolvase RusA-like endonuclease